ncbi:MAG: hypothetical protein ACRC33_21965, partial [Gemmataceae bacterium]
MDADSFPPPEVGLALHARLLATDGVADADICCHFLPPLVAHLSRCRPRLPPDLLLTAAHDAVLGYLRRPAAFDPAQLDLGGYLRMAAWRDLLNLLRRERPFFSLHDVEDPGAAGNSPADGVLGA